MGEEEIPLLAGGFPEGGVNPGLAVMSTCVIMMTIVI
jgi:hypothetical protein